MTLCQFDPETLSCTACGYRARRLPTRRICRPPPAPAPRPIMLGDLAERGLAAIGITKRRVERITGRPCGCYHRQQRLNRWGVRAQQELRVAARSLRRFFVGD